MYWLRDIYGDCINISNADSIFVETFPDDQYLKNSCTVMANIHGNDYVLWEEKPASNKGTDIEKTVAKAHLFIDALVQRLNNAE